jgi:hypothetical protein
MAEAGSVRASLAAWLEAVTVPSRDPFLGAGEEEEEDGEEEGERLDPTWGREGAADCQVVSGEEAVAGARDGAARLLWPDGDSVQGRFAGGAREGGGVVSGASSGHSAPPPR